MSFRVLKRYHEARTIGFGAFGNINVNISQCQAFVQLCAGCRLCVMFKSEKPKTQLVRSLFLGQIVTQWYLPLSKASTFGYRKAVTIGIKQDQGKMSSSFILVAIFFCLFILWQVGGSFILCRVG